MKLTHFKCLYYKKKKVPAHLDEEGDFVSSFIRTCEGNCGKLYSVV